MFQPLSGKSKAPEPPLPGPGQYEPNRAFNIVTQAKNVAPVYSSFSTITEKADYSAKGLQSLCTHFKHIVDQLLGKQKF